MTKSKFTIRIIAAIRAIPVGRVATYGDIADLAGNARGARQVARTLHTLSELEKLPWHRVINREGRISLKPFHGYEEQKELLESEGVVFDDRDRINLNQFRWQPDIDWFIEYE